MKNIFNNRYAIAALIVLNIVTILAIAWAVVAWLRLPASPTPIQTSSMAAPHPRVKYSLGQAYLLIEVLDDDLVHFELSDAGPGPAVTQTLQTSPMVDKNDYPGPSRFDYDGQGRLETAELVLQVDARRLCVSISDVSRPPAAELVTFCPLGQTRTTENKRPLGQTRRPEQTRLSEQARLFSGLNLSSDGAWHVYGLGEQFAENKPLNWVGRVRSPGNKDGNAMQSFMGGMVGNAQFPVMYALGEDGRNYALFLDDIYQQIWDFSHEVWSVNTPGQPLRWYVLSGPDLPDLRQDYMDLTGRPPVPPKKLFGLWVSEYGYDNWAELEDKLASLRAGKVPVDGFVLDLQWYGGIKANSGDTRMGSLTWDSQNFPDPEKTIARLRDEQGVGLMAIEQSYVGRWLPEHEDLEKRGYLVRQEQDGPPVLLRQNPWWGTGGMIDWSNDAAGDYWHDWKRQPLIEAGLVGHWTDLGEPELYDPGAWYYGFPEQNQHAHQDIHNLYNFKWSQSIQRGYARHGVQRRAFILSRSGAPGSQRFGVSMWSGDIGSNMSSLAAHLDVQAHMALSGMDYFGADIGGFYRQALDGDADELYTRWLANGLAFDIPARAHTQNLCNCYETAPDRIGDLASALDNVRQRYALSPYLYSLAHRAYRNGEAIVSPLLYYYQSDLNVQQIGHEKMVGRDVLIAGVAAYQTTHQDVYLPAGRWVNYHTHTWYESQGQTFKDIPLVLDGKFKLPMFVRAGALLPHMAVDEHTLNIEGWRDDGLRRDELIVRAYAGPTGRFTLYEDDGQTIAYQSGHVRSTVLEMEQTGDVLTVTVAGATGDYAGALASRDNIIILALDQAQASQVSLNGQALPQHTSQAAFEQASRGWYMAGDNRVLARSGQQPVENAKVFQFRIR